MKKISFIKKLFLFGMILFLIDTSACSEDTARVSQESYSPETENAVEATVPGNPEPPDPSYRRVHFEWEYDYSTWSYDLDIPIDAVEAYRSACRQPESYYELYSSYITEPTDDEYLHSLAQVFINSTKENNLPKEDAVPMAVAFVQHLDYIDDDPSSDMDYPKYPLETLYDHGGDCEDTSILLCSLIREMGYGCCLIGFEDHMAVGILGDDSMEGFYFEKDDQKYYYIETTAEGWPIGEMPEEYQKEDARLWVF